METPVHLTALQARRRPTSFARCYARTESGAATARRMSRFKALAALAGGAKSSLVKISWKQRASFCRWTRPAREKRTAVRARGRLELDARDWMRRVPRFELLDLVVAQRDLLGRERVLDVPEFRRADDRRGHARLVQQPRERKLGRRDTADAGHLRQAFNQRPIELGLVERLQERIAPGASRLLVPPRKQAASKRAPRDHADALVDALRNHLPLLLAVDQVVVVLHRHERRRSDALRLRELPGVHAAGADVAGLSGLHDVVQRAHRLLDRRRLVPAVDLVEVDVVEAEPLERGIDRGEDVLARQAAPVLALHGPTVHLRRDYVLLAHAEELAQHPAGDDLTLTAVVDV